MNNPNNRGGQQQGGQDPSTKELNAFVQNMLKQMQDRFDQMSSNIISRVDQMGMIYINNKQVREQMMYRSQLDR